jgi:hypothetical protein
MNTKPALLLTSAFTAIALFYSIPAQAEDEASQKPDAGKKDAKECHESSDCDKGVCPVTSEKKGEDKKEKPEDQAAKPAPAASDTSNQ